MERGEREREIEEREGRGQIYIHVHVGGESSLVHRLASLEIREGDWGFLYQFCSTCHCLSVSHDSQKVFETETCRSRCVHCSCA